MKTFLRTGNLAVRLLRLFSGLFAYGFAIALMVHGNIGLAPWDVLTQGVSRTTGLSFGWCVILTSVAVLLLWIPLRQKPGFGTLVNVALIGVFADLGLAVLPSPGELGWQIVMFLSGMVLLAFATALYVGARLGPGPRDGLMTGLVRRTAKPVWMIRSGIEISVVLLGFLLGGTVGAGTVVFALGIGPITQIAFRCLLVDLSAPEPSAQPVISTTTTPSAVLPGETA
ncbi:YitT family protein [Psychromicrobium sp. YIM B11713]|uniref:membrane protein YczE n=1 Tax=Psychromicrobium sp. YIM B11713 TaxID=3145233 RepID=UPI00374F594A